MCGIACYLGNNPNSGSEFAEKVLPLLRHRGPDDSGVYHDGIVTLVHLRLSILELSEMGHQPMTSSCGRYKIIFNGEIYNHLELRQRFLSGHAFRGHSDTETILELFRLQKEKMLDHMVGMWAIVIYDLQDQKIFITRDRFGQKPVYLRCLNKDEWYLSSEMRALIAGNEQMQLNPTAVVEYLALGNYGHLGNNTFFKDIHHFPQGHYAWMKPGDKEIKSTAYWELPRISTKDAIPFDETAKNKLREVVIEAVSSQTLSDVPIGITLSGGIDSSIITGILSRHYDKELHVFTAQTPESKFDETRYVDAVIAKWNNPRLVVHHKNLNIMSLKNELEPFINIQEEPFGDPSIIAHGSLMRMAADAGIKVILNGQGADEIFFGYNNMARATLPYQLRAGMFGAFSANIKAMNLGSSYALRALLQFLMPGKEYDLRVKSRAARRSHIVPSLTGQVDEGSIIMYSSANLDNVWRESVYGTHLPHLVQYDDRNGMACSIEGRSPFLDHRIAELVATIDPVYYLKNGLRKYILREAFKDYLPAEVYSRTDKIGFYTPLVDALQKDKEWVISKYKDMPVVTAAHREAMIAALSGVSLSTNDALNIYRELSVVLWMKLFNVGNLSIDH